MHLLQQTRSLVDDSRQFRIDNRVIPSKHPAHNLLVLSRLRFSKLRSWRATAWAIPH